MRKALLIMAAASFATSAFGADVGFPKAPPLAVAPYDPFYIGVYGGGVATSAQNEIAIPGLAAGTPKVNPVGAEAGLVLGYGGPLAGGFYLGAEGRVGYNFGGHASIGCFPTLPCVASAKNAFSASEMVQFGVTSAFWQNLTLGIQGGAVERQVKFSVLDLNTLQSMNAEKFLVGPGLGAFAKVAVSKQSEIGANYVHAIYKGSFTPLQSVPFFSSTVQAKDSDEFTLFYLYHL